MKFGSVCSGIEAASVAWESLGFSAEWLSEIEAFPSEVLMTHFPDTPNLGDMTKIPNAVLHGEVEAPEVLVGGTPCQAFSIAGMRAGMSDPRGALTISYVRLIDAIDYVRTRRGDKPGIAVWENVPGVLSSDDNAFGTFLAALAGEDTPLEPAPRPALGKSNQFWRWKAEKGHEDGGYHAPRWTNAGCVYGPKRAVAWRVLDAQYFGLAQRRRRVFVVASARDGFDPAAVLLEFDGVRRDSAPSRDTRQDLARDTAPCAASSGCGIGQNAVGQGQGSAIGADCYNGSITGDVAATMGTSGSSVNAAGPTVMVESARQPRWKQFRMNKVASGVLRSIRPRQTHCTTDVSMAFQQNTRDEVRFMGGDGLIAGALAAMHGSKQQNYILTTRTREPYWLNGRQDPVSSEGISGPLDTFDRTGVVVTGSHKKIRHFQEAQYGVAEYDTAGTLRAGRIPEHEMIVQEAPVAFSCKDYGADASNDLSPTLRAMGHATSHQNAGGQVAIAFAQNQVGEVRTSDVIGALNTNSNASGRNTPMVMEYDAISIHPHCIGRKPEAGPQGKDYIDDGSAYTMDSRGVSQGVAVIPRNQERTSDDVTLPIHDKATRYKGGGPTRNGDGSANGLGIGKPTDPCPTLDTGGNHGVFNSQAMAVRRLMPVECERLQGFTDGWTAIKRKNKEAADGPRYKVLGNSMAVPVMHWIGKRLKMMAEHGTCLSQ